MDQGGRLQAFPVVAVKAEGVDLHGEPTTAHAFHSFSYRHIHRPPGYFPGILQHGTGDASGLQLAVVGIATVWKGLQGQADAFPGSVPEGEPIFPCPG